MNLHMYIKLEHYQNLQEPPVQEWYKSVAHEINSCTASLKQNDYYEKEQIIHTLSQDHSGQIAHNYLSKSNSVPHKHPDRYK